MPSAVRAEFRWWALRALGSNPLLRRSDRAEATVMAVAALLTFAAIPIAVNAGDSAYRAELQMVRQETQSRQPTLAVATADSTARPGYPAMATVPVQWSLGAVTRDTVVAVDHPVKASESVQLWTDEVGEVAAAPRGVMHARLAGVAVGVTAVLAAMVSGGALVLFVRVVSNRYRFRNWELEHQRLFP